MKFNKSLFERYDIKVIYIQGAEIAFIPKYEIFIYAGHNYYYIVQCKLPLALAEKLYKEELFWKQIRAGAHGYYQEPGLHCSWYHKDTGQQLVSEDEYLKMEDFVNKGFIPKSSFLKYFGAKEEYFSVLGNAYVELYHIDGDEAIKRFIKFILF